MKKKVVLFYYQIIGKKKLYLQCSSTLPQSRLRGGANGRSLKLLEFICVSKLHCSSENAKYCQFQRGKKLSSPQYAWFSSTGSNIWNQREQRIGI